MRRVLSFAIATCLAIVALVQPLAAKETAPSVSTLALRGPLHMLQGKGGNVVVSFGSDGVLLVDDDYADLAPAYATALAALTETDQTPIFILNTHWHSDHAGGNLFWAERGATVVAQRNVRERMAKGQMIPAIDWEVPASPAKALPVVTFSDSLALHFNGTDIEVQHFPAGHTDGDSVMFFTQQNVVHMGDLFFKDRFPFIDTSSGGSVAGYIANLEAILQRVDDDTMIVPGHGSLASKVDLEAFHRMVTTTTATVKAAVTEGMSVEALIKRGLGEEWASWGEGFINESAWIQTIASDL